MVHDRVIDLISKFSPARNNSSVTHDVTDMAYGILVTSNELLLSIIRQK